MYFIAGELLLTSRVGAAFHLHASPRSYDERQRPCSTAVRNEPESPAGIATDGAAEYRDAIPPGRQLTLPGWRWQPADRLPPMGVHLPCHPTRGGDPPSLPVCRHSLPHRRRAHGRLPVAARSPEQVAIGPAGAHSVGALALGGDHRRPLAV